MDHMTDLNAVFTEVQAAIADSLAVPKSDIRLESRLLDDLGADSLDLVDIIFTLERKFGINVRETEFNFLTRLDFSSPEVMQNGFLTPDVVERLAVWLTGLDSVEDKNRVTPRQLFSSITVASICRVVTRSSAGAHTQAPAG
jgi:acyl carrier protein